MKKPITSLCALAVMFALSSPPDAFAAPSKKSAKKYSVSKRYSSKKSRTSSKKKRRSVFTCDQYSRKTLQRKSKRFAGTINSASKKYGVSAHFIRAVIAVESCFNPRARGGLGEKGLMQLMPGTARELGVKNGYSPWQNIHGGTKYLKRLLVRYNGNKHYAAAAYNGGPGAVSVKYGPKFQQVRRYSKHLMRAYTTLTRGKGAGITPVKSRKISLKRSKSKKYNSSKKKRSLRLSKKTYKKTRLSKKYKKASLKSKSSKRKSHYIKSGQTLYSIARAHKTSVKKLKRLNGLRSNTIRVGKRLRVR